MGDLVGKLLGAASVPPHVPSISPWVAYVVGAVLESLHRVLRISAEPLVTRFVAREFATAHWFDIGATRRDLRYEPAISIDEGIDRLARFLHSSAGVTS
jgi:nucleoside-diphosphate-sugar epimerase